MKTNAAILLPLALFVPSVVAQAPRVDTIRVGTPALRGAELRIGSATQRSFVRNGGVDTPTATTTRRITKREQGSRSVYVIETMHIAGAGDTTVGTIEARAADFALLHHRVKAAHDSAAVAVSDGHITGWVVLPDEPIRLIDQRLADPVFPVEGQMPWLFPLLPLREGYAATIPHYSQWDGEEQWATLQVTGSENVMVGGRTLECFTIDGGPFGPPGYRATHWVEKRTRRIVQSALRSEGGGREYWAVAEMP